MMALWISIKEKELLSQILLRHNALPQNEDIISENENILNKQTKP